MKRKSRAEHDREVDGLRQAPQQRGSRRGVPSHMTHGGSLVTTRGLRNLNSLIDITPNAALAEPGVTMDQLVRSTLALGYVPKVVPEFKEITVAGAIMGAGLESSSFRFGQFNDTVGRCELLTAGGERIAASERENADLFYGISGSYGSLASLTLAEVELMPAQPLVELRKVRYLNAEAFLAALDDPQGADYVDGLLMPDQSYLLMRGWLRSQGSITCRFSRPWDRWFCQHVIESPTSTDVMPLYDYIFRYDRAAFWMGQFATRGRALLRYLMEWRLDASTLPERLHTCFKAAPPTLSPAWWLRLGLGWKLSSAKLYHVLHSMPRTALARSFLVQDYYIPRAQVGEFLEQVRTRTAIVPLWLCPMRGTRSHQPLSPHSSANGTSFVNVGVYGVPAESERVLAITAELEAECARLGGRKMLYGVNSYDSSTFWSIYPKGQYDDLRRRWRAEGVFKDLYERVCFHGSD